MSRLHSVVLAVLLLSLSHACDSSSSGGFANSNNLAVDPATANVIGPAIYRDENFDGKVNAGDTIELQFDKDVRVVGTTIELDFPVLGDSLGGVTLIRPLANPRRVRLVLDDDWAFRCRQLYRGSKNGLDSASALTVVGSDSIKGGAKGRAGRSPPADLQPAFLRDTRTDFDLAGQNVGFATGLDAGDFDQDGQADLATSFPGSIKVWRNTGPTFQVTHTVGWFSPWNGVRMVDLNQDGRADLAGVSDFEVGVWFYNPVKDRYAKQFRDYDVKGVALAVGDLVGDNLPDIVVATTSNRLQIYRNNGPAGFRRVTSSALAFPATCVAVGDLDRDGDEDIIAASLTAVQWWRNAALRGSNGTLSDLEPSTTTMPTRDTHAIVLADADRDGLPDLFLGNDGPNEVWRNTSTPDGISFQPTGQELGDSFTRAVAALDLDADGHPDFVAGNAQDQPDRIYVHQNNLRFLDSGQRLGADSTTHLVAADFDGDGDHDLAAANETWNRLWRSSLAGTTDSQAFQKARYDSHSFERSDTVALATGDLDNDGDPDLVCANGTRPRSLLDNPGNGRFQWIRTPFEGASGAPASPDTRAVELVDVNLDGHLDVIFANRAAAGGGARNELWLANDDGGFDFHQTLGNFASADVVSADLNQDGFPDLLFASELASEDSEVYLNRVDPGRWFPTSPSSTFESGAATVALATGDLNRDSIPDIVTANQAPGGGAANHAFTGDGKGGLVATGVPFQVSGAEAILHTSDVTLADMNRDGCLDALFAQRSVGGLSGATQMFLGAGDGTFTFGGDDGVLVQEVMGIATADVDFDGAPDLFLAQRGTGETAIPRDDAIQLNPWVAGGTAFGVLVDLGERRNSRQVVVEDVDGDGDQDFVVAVEGGKNLVFLRR